MNYSGHKIPLVERSIYKTPAGSFTVRRRSGGIDRHITVDSLEQARDIRDSTPAVFRHIVRNRRTATQGWFDVLKDDGNEWIDTPPKSSAAVARSKVTHRMARERDFMLSERFQKAVHRLPRDCVAEAKASASLSALQYATGQVLVKRALRGLTDRPAYVIVPSEPHPDHRKAVESLGVKVIVP